MTKKENATVYQRGQMFTSSQIGSFGSGFYGLLELCVNRLSVERDSPFIWHLSRIYPPYGSKWSVLFFCFWETPTEKIPENTHIPEEIVGGMMAAQAVNVTWQIDDGNDCFMSGEFQSLGLE